MILCGSRYYKATCPPTRYKPAIRFLKLERDGSAWMCGEFADRLRRNSEEDNLRNANWTRKSSDETIPQFALYGAETYYGFDASLRLRTQNLQWSTNPQHIHKSSGRIQMRKRLDGPPPLVDFQDEPPAAAQKA